MGVWGPFGGPKMKVPGKKFGVENSQGGEEGSHRHWGMARLPNCLAPVSVPPQQRGPGPTWVRVRPAGSRLSAGVRSAGRPEAGAHQSVGRPSLRLPPRLWTSGVGRTPPPVQRWRLSGKRSSHRSVEPKAQSPVPLPRPRRPSASLRPSCKSLHPSSAGCP